MSSLESTESQAIPLEGRLSDPATLPRLMSWLGRGEWSGMVLLRSGDVERRLYFAEGRLSTAGSNDSGDALASQLIRDGLISEEDRSRAAGQLRTTDRGWGFGRQLVKLGLLSEHDLARAERRRVLGVALAALGLRSGQYSCEAGAVAGDAMPNQGLEVPRVVAEGVLTTWEPNSALDVLGGRGAVLDIVIETLSDYEATGAAEEYDATMLRCNGRRSVQEVLDISPLPEAAALRFLAAMRLLGCVSSVPGAPAAPPAYDPEATLPPDDVHGQGAPEVVREAEAAPKAAPVDAVPDFEAARAEAIAPAAGSKAPSRPAAGRVKETAGEASGAAAASGSAAPSAARDAAAATSRSRSATILVLLLSLALLAGAGYVAWRGWREMQAAPVESP